MVQNVDSRFYDRVLPHMDAINRSDMPEGSKLAAIGNIVGGTLRDLIPAYHTSSSVDPSVLPDHDASTIDRLARIQAHLRRSSLSASQQAWYLEKAEHACLVMQREDRPRSVGLN